MFTVCAGVSLTKCLTHPIAELADAADTMAQGDMDADIADTSQDELGELAASTRNLGDQGKAVVKDISYLLGEIAKGNLQAESRAEHSDTGEYRAILSAMQSIGRHLSSALSEINVASGQVSAGADQVAAAAQSLSQGTAENAARANTISQDTGAEVMKGNQCMQELMRAMNEITETSNEINKVIQAIEDIAFQTNLLALNAAVEAAHAGSAGKGFAVVADEVHNLAGKSAEATKNTTELIQNAIAAAEKGRGIAEETASALETVVHKAGTSLDKIQMITEASKQQANAAGQVTAGIVQISSVVQTNSATAQESTAASEEISSQAQTLRNLVASFRLRESSR